MLKRGFVFAIVLGVFLMSVSFATALPQASIDVKQSFNVGESVSFTYSILSDVDVNVSYKVGVKCDENIPIPFFSERNASLAANVAHTGTFNAGVLSDSASGSGNCNATVSITDSGIFAQKQFRIEATPGLNININLCKDSSCSAQTIVFKKGDKVYLSLNSDLTGIVTVAKLTDSNGVTKEVTLPYDFVASDVGSYTLEVSASKSGYNEASASKQFAVINSNSDIQYAVESEGQNAGAVVSNRSWTNSYLVYLIIGIVALIVIAFVVKIVMKKSGN